jgi:hypoxanthine-DNA glycosylase
LSRLDYLARLQALLRHRVGLWDVVAQAQREGSLDSRIRNHASNDLVALVESLPHLAAVAFNGGTAARLGMRALQGAVGKVEFMSLPSSSPAYTMPYAQKLKAWEALRPWLVEGDSVDASRSSGTE